jgi:mRNA interferase RelE/StbE
MNEMVTISREEYDRLRAAAEDLADLSAYDAIKARFAAGQEELIPTAFADRLVDGESAVRVFRELRGLTQSGLSRVSSVNRVQIADIEAGRSAGSIETMRKLAEALQVTIDDLV